MFELTQNQKASNSSSLEKELLIRNEMLDRHTEDLFREFQISEEELSDFLKTQENFTEKAWEAIEKERETLEQRLESELQAKTSLRKKKPAPNHWIPVR